MNYKPSNNLTNKYNRISPPHELKTGYISEYYVKQIQNIPETIYNKYTDETKKKNSKFYIPYFDINILYAILNFITKQQTTDHEGFTILNSEILRTDLSYEYKLYFEFLIESNIIYSNNYSNHDNPENKITSKGFKIVKNDSYNFFTLNSHRKIIKFNYIGKIKSSKKSTKIETESIVVNKTNTNLDELINSLNGQLKNIRIDKHVKPFLLSQLKSNEININSYTRSLAFVESINDVNNNKLFGYSNNGRIYSPFILAKSELRPYVYYEKYGRKTYFDILDMDSAQPTLLSNALKHVKSKYHNIIKNEDIYTYLIDKLKETETETEYYDTVQVESRENKYITTKYPIETLTRDKVKVLFYKSLFSRFTSRNSINALLKKLFPEIVLASKQLTKDLRVKDNLNKKVSDGSIFSTYLQTLESDLFNEVSKRAVAENIVVIPLYDGLAYLPQQAEELNGIIKDVFKTLTYKMHYECNINHKQEQKKITLKPNESAFSVDVVDEVKRKINKLMYIDVKNIKEYKKLIHKKAVTNKSKHKIFHLNHTNLINDSITRLKEILVINTYIKNEYMHNDLHFKYNNLEVFSYILKEFKHILKGNITFSQKFKLFLYLNELKKMFKIKDKWFCFTIDDIIQKVNDFSFHDIQTIINNRLSNKQKYNDKLYILHFLRNSINKINLTLPCRVINQYIIIPINNHINSP